ncbi:TPA: accessory Sec system protein Asp3 [Streptococcus suis]|nr:accessory Sec system protein Asp3 [Streptococcus suis]HEM6345924.1 accessory Sec system protein Asp3 [Streptococcus suis]
MSEYFVQNIYWGDTANGGDYLYGSVIQHLDKGVRFSNLRFASGKPIKKWESRTNYQGNRRSPVLPLLRPGHSYRLKQHFQVEPAGRAYIQIRFLNRRGVEVGLTILKNGEEEFTCPADYFTYTLTLYSAGCHTVEFYKLSLYSLDKPQTIHLSDEPRGFYAKERYPSDIAFVKHLIRGLKEEGAE